MNRLLSAAAVLAACVALAGCDSYTGAPYPVSISANTTLRSYRPANVAVDTFTTKVDPSMTCRLDGPIHIPGGESPQEYLTKAFRDQFMLAGLDNKAAPKVTISGEVTRFGFSSIDGAWNLGVILHSSNGHSLDVVDSYPFSSSYVAEAACNDVANAFAPAVQSLVKQAINEPGFHRLLK